MVSISPRAAGLRPHTANQHPALGPAHSLCVRPLAPPSTAAPRLRPRPLSRWAPGAGPAASTPASPSAAAAVTWHWRTELRCGCGSVAAGSRSLLRCRDPRRRCAVARRLPQLGSWPRAPSTPSAMASAGGPEAAGPCPRLSLLLLLLIAGPALGWSDPGEWCPHSPLPAAFSRRWEAPRATRSVRRPLSPSTGIPYFHLLPSSARCLAPLLSQTSSGRGELWGVGGAGRLRIRNIPFLPSLDSQNLSTFSFLGLQPSSLSLTGKLDTHLRVLLCCYDCLMSSSRTVVMAACCYGWQWPWLRQALSHT